MSRIYLITIIFSLLILLIGRFLLFYAHGEPPRAGEVITIQTTLLTEPKLSGNQQVFTLYYQDRWRITVRIPRYPMFHYGDSFLVTGKVKIKSIESIGVEKTIYSMDYPEVKDLSKSSNYLVRFASFIRRNVAATFHQYLPPPADSLLLGIVFGINESMPEDFQDDLRTGGVLHVIAASGMNVSMVAGALFLILSSFLKRRQAVLISIVGIIFYAVLSGLQPSILRASLMGILVFSASLLGRQNTALVTLGITAYLMLFLRPVLLSDVGFQLSFFSTLGILMIKPLFSELEKRGEFLADITTTISAQIATLPIMLMTFGQYGIVSILVNALVLWTIPPLMVLGSLAALSGLIFRPLAMPLLYLALPFLWFFARVVAFFGEYQLTLTVTIFPFALGIGYYIILCSLIWFLKRREVVEV